MPAAKALPLLLAHRAAAAASRTRPVPGRRKVFARERRCAICSGRDRLHRRLNVGERILRDNGLRLILVIDRPLQEAGGRLSREILARLLVGIVVIAVELLRLIETAAAVHASRLLRSRHCGVLGLRRHDDSVVMLSVLQVIFRGDRVSG